MFYNKKHMSVEEAIAEIQARQEAGMTVKMCVNPYNHTLIRVDFLDESVNPPPYEVVWAEKLTKRDKEMLLDIADDVMVMLGSLW